MSNSQNAGEPNVKFCARCRLPIDVDNSVNIQGTCFHKDCCQCYVCRTVPRNPKFYVGRIFCEHCLAKYLHLGPGHVPNNPSEFFKDCFENLKDPKFQETMFQFMSTAATSSVKKNPDVDALTSKWSIDDHLFSEIGTVEQKIVKLTKYLNKVNEQKNKKMFKKWKNFTETNATDIFVTPVFQRCGSKFVQSLEESKLCPKCLWQDWTFIR